MRRKQRRGFWQRFVLPQFGYFPWECARCRKSVLIRYRGLVQHAKSG